MSNSHIILGIHYWEHLNILHSETTLVNEFISERANNNWQDSEIEEKKLTICIQF